MYKTKKMKLKRDFEDLRDCPFAYSERVIDKAETLMGDDPERLCELLHEMEWLEHYANKLEVNATTDVENIIKVQIKNIIGGVFP